MVATENPLGPCWHTARLHCPTESSSTNTRVRTSPVEWSIQKCIVDFEMTFCIRVKYSPANKLFSSVYSINETLWDVDDPMG